MRSLPYFTCPNLLWTKVHLVSALADASTSLFRSEQAAADCFIFRYRCGYATPVSHRTTVSEYDMARGRYIASLQGTLYLHQSLPSEESGDVREWAAQYIESLNFRLLSPLLPCPVTLLEPFLSNQTYGFCYRQSLF